MKKSSIDPGQIIVTADGQAFRVKGKSASSSGEKYQLTNFSGTKKLTAVLERGVLSPFMIHVAGHLRSIIAFNKDFDAIIKESIREAGYPVDESVNWSKWFATNFEKKLRERTKMLDEDLADEACQHVIVQELYDRHALAKFDPNLVPDDVKEKPLDKQITFFLQQNVFRKRYSEAVLFCNKQYGWKAEEDSNVGGTCLECGSKNLRRSEGGGWECLDCGHFSNFAVRRAPQQLFQTGEEGEYNVVDSEGIGTREDTSSEDQQELQAIRDEFYEFVKTTRSEKVAAILAKIFDYVVESEKGKKVEFLDQFKKDTGLGGDRLKQLYKEFGDQMSAFAEQYPDDVPGHPILDLIKRFNKKKKDSKVLSSLNLAGKTATIEHKPGHKDSEGKDAPWCNVKDGKILDSHATKEEAEKALRAHEYFKGAAYYDSNTGVSEPPPQNVPAPPSEGVVPYQQGPALPGQPQYTNQNQAQPPRTTVPPELPNQQLHEVRDVTSSLNTARIESTVPQEKNIMATTKEARTEMLKKIAERKKARETAAKTTSKAAAGRTTHKLVVLAKEKPLEVQAAITELADFFGGIRASFLNLRDNLNLTDLPKTASPKEKTAHQAKFASGLKKLAEENPGELGEALSEVYGLLDEAAGAVENLADNTGVELSEPAAPFAEVEVHDEPIVEETVTEEPVTEEPLSEEPAEEKEASGSDNFFMSNEPDAEKKFGSKKKSPAPCPHCHK
jgi:hypothetical protein